MLKHLSLVLKSITLDRISRLFHNVQKFKLPTILSGFPDTLTSQNASNMLTYQSFTLIMEYNTEISGYFLLL